MRRLTSGATLAAFRTPGFGPLWLSSAAAAFGHAVSVVAIGWITLQVSNSALAVGAAFAARLVPSLLLGIALGNVVDRFDRARTLVLVNVLGVVPLIAGAALIGQLDADIVGLLVLSLALGVIDTLRGTATQAYTFDLAGPAGATNAIALANLGGFLLGVAGSIIGGIVLDWAGTRNTFLLAAAATAVAGAVLVAARRRSPSGPQAPRPERVAPSLGRSLTLIARNRPVALIALIVIVAETFGFSGATLFPTFARDVLGSDASGLGTLVAARYAGSIASLLLVARVGMGGTGGFAILLTTFGLGASLLGFAVSNVFVVSLALMVVVGAASAALDSVVQARLQHVVDDAERGSAVGIWYFAVGFGPIGNLGLGAAAGAIGAPPALAVSGALLAVFAVGLSTLRRARRLL